jgi:pilus assembly protein CpaF
MNTGHAGSMSTIHANSPVDALSRLETLTLLSGTELPLRAVRDQIASAMDLIVHLGRMPNGDRRVIAVTEVGRVVDGEIKLTEIYNFEYNKTDKTKSRGDGVLVPTKAIPAFAERMSDIGVDFPNRLFGLKG